MRRPMENNSNLGQAVYDPFLGSGTTLIAAETSGRVCVAMELEPRYVDVAVKRWQAFTGKSACLLSDGRSFAQVSVARLSNQNGAPNSTTLNECGEADWRYDRPKNEATGTERDRSQRPWASIQP
jgi:hypothetical protein